MKVYVKGLNSCPMRKGDVQQYRDFLVANNHIVVDHPSQSDVILLWTCAFRSDFRDSGLEQIKYYSQNYSAELVVAGCLPDIDEEMLKEHFHGRIINWRNDEQKLTEFFNISAVQLSQIPRRLIEPRLYEDVTMYKKQHPEANATFHDQFIKLYIQEGCRFHCTYCAEILTFPPYFSFPEDELVEACRREVESSENPEIILLGDSIGDYGSDIGLTLPHLIKRLFEIHPNIKIALANLHPAHFIKYLDEMTRFIKLGRIRHISLPIQSASNRILSLMNRGYQREHMDKMFTLLNDLNFTEFETHLIFGFPSETDGDAEETIAFILKHGPRYVLASSFMESPKMPAAKLNGKIDVETKYLRTKYAGERIRAAGILCNSDDSELSVIRRRVLARD